MPVQTITSMSELQTLANTSRLTVVDCFAKWCNPCAAISPFVEELSKKYSSTNFCKVDVDEAEEVAKNLGDTLKRDIRLCCRIVPWRE